MAVEDREAWWCSGVDEVDVVDELVSMKLHNGRSIVELNMVCDGLVRIESDCNDHGGVLGRFRHARSHTLGHQHEIRFWICADTTGTKSSARIQVEADRVAS